MFRTKCYICLIIIIYLLKYIFCDNLYLHPKFSTDFKTEYEPVLGKEQYLHPTLYEILKLSSTHESNFYSLDNNGNPLIITKSSLIKNSEIGQISIPASMLSSYDPSLVLAKTFINTNMLSVCGDGILDTSNGEKCEFVLNTNLEHSCLATTPPPNYHLEWVYDKRQIDPIQRECLWAPGRIGACLNKASFGGVQRPQLPSHIFTHYCGDGIFDISSTFSLLDSLLEAWKKPNSKYRQFFTICGYIEEHCLLPIYCNEGVKPWIVPGKTIRFTSNSLEQCDLGEKQNGAPFSGCTSRCTLRCSYQRGGRVDWNDWPRLACHQPCLDERWTGIYCDIPNCLHGVPNPQDGGCYSHCEPGWIGLTCSQNICGNGTVAGWADETSKRPICVCKPGWYGKRCDKSYCTGWSEEGMCLSCIPGKRNPTSYCIQDACVYGEKSSAADGTCVQPCKVKFFEGKYCNETKCIEWDMESSDFDFLKCTQCLPGYSLPYCKPYSGLKGYARCTDPWTFGPDCSQVRRKESKSTECIEGWTGPYCTLMKCARGYPDFSNPELQCIPGTCIPGWKGKWCEINNLISIYDISKNTDWATARTKLFQYYTHLTESSPTGIALKKWKRFATLIIYGRRPTALITQGFNERHMDWQENIKNSMTRVYLSERVNIWTSLKPDPGLHAAINSLKFEVEEFLKRLAASENLYIGIKEKDTEYDIPIQNKCLNGIHSTNSSFLPCEVCAGGWFGEYCDNTNCVAFSSDNSYCTKCKDRFEGELCQFKKEEKLNFCSEGWNGSKCNMPKCLYGYRLVSPVSPVNLPQAKNIENLKTLMDSSPRITKVDRIERLWIEKYSPCAISHADLNVTHLDLSMHQIAQVSSGLWLCDGLPLRTADDPRCSACYPGFEGDFCNLMQNNERIQEIDDCKDICVRGLWNWRAGVCFPCFSGSSGRRCEETYCLKWSPSNSTCDHCRHLDFQNVQLKRPLMKVSFLSQTFGQRFGSYCELKGLCQYGIQSKKDEGCISCSSQCISGPYCNITNCATFSEEKSCSSCLEGWEGFCCQERKDQKKQNIGMDLLLSTINTCKSIGLIGWPHCNYTRCQYGALDPSDTEYLRCIPDSCFPGWAGPWCSFSLWKSEERSPAQLKHLFNQLQAAMETAESTEDEEYKVGLWQGKKLVKFKGKLFSDVFPILRYPECNYPSLSGHNCDERLCKNGMISSDSDFRCSSCFPGWIGPYCNETHRIPHSEFECEDGWWNPILCDKQSQCQIAPHSEQLKCPIPGGIPDAFSKGCVSCACPTYFKGPFCNETTCIHGTPTMNPLHGGGCVPDSCSFGWKGPFCNESMCLHGYRQIGSAFEHNIYSYDPSQHWTYGWRGIGRFSNSLSVDFTNSSPKCTACYQGYPNNPFCEKIYEDDKSPCLHGWFDYRTATCSDCFPGWSGPNCSESACLQWLIPYVKCKECHPGLYGPLCEFTSLCVHGVIDRRSAVGACQQPCLVRFFEGPYCNITHCGNIDPISGLPKLDSKGHCIECKEGFTGPFCSTHLTCINGLASIFSSVPGACLPNSCSSGWTGLWCHRRTFFRPAHPHSDECLEGWTGDLCDVPDCKHGVPNFFDGWCRWCHPGWTGRSCGSKPCLFGIPNLLHQPMFDNEDYKKELELYSPPCILGTCLESWKGPACSEPTCFGSTVDDSIWNGTSPFQEFLFGNLVKMADLPSMPFIHSRKIEANRPDQISVDHVHPNHMAIDAGISGIIPSLDGSIPGIDWNTLKCTSCSHPYYRLPSCDRINRCVWGILDEVSSDGRCIPNTCQRGGGPFCSKPICYHGIPDPQNTLGCQECYSGWKGYSTETIHPSILNEYERPSVDDLAFDALPILVCDMPTCANGWMQFLHSPDVDSHTYTCICFDGWEGADCDVSSEEGFSPKKASSQPYVPGERHQQPDNTTNSIYVVEVAPVNGCPPGTIDSLLLELYLKQQDLNGTGVV